MARLVANLAGQTNVVLEQPAKVTESQNVSVLNQDSDCSYSIFQGIFRSAKITSDMSRHTVIYLDTNYLSNMAKAQLGSITDQDECKFWFSLLEDLKDKVLSDAIACPEFSFQQEEASFDARIEEAVGRIIDELSQGLKFNTWKDILDLQIEEAAYKFLGKDPPQRETWAIAFTSNPQASVRSGVRGGYPYPNYGVDASPLSQNEIVKYKRQQKARWVDYAGGTLKPYTRHSWDETLRRDKLYSVDCILGPKAWADAEMLNKFGSSADMQELTDRLVRLLEIGITGGNFMDFLKSDELLNSAFIDIHSSIRTAAAKYFPKRKQKGSDLRDPVMLASVIPYSDMVTTDKFMKHLSVTCLGLEQKYKCKIFSLSKEDRLNFQKKVKESK